MRHSLIQRDGAIKTASNDLSSERAREKEPSHNNRNKNIKREHKIQSIKKKKRRRQRKKKEEKKEEKKKNPREKKYKFKNHTATMIITYNIAH